jgi:hypothetical protein
VRGACWQLGVKKNSVLAVKGSLMGLDYDGLVPTAAAGAGYMVHSNKKKNVGARYKQRRAIDQKDENVAI